MSQTGTSTSKYSHIPIKYVYKLNILYKILKLSNPGAAKVSTLGYNLNNARNFGW